MNQIKRKFSKWAEPLCEHAAEWITRGVGLWTTPVSISSSVFFCLQIKCNRHAVPADPTRPSGRTHPCRLCSRGDLWGGDKVRMIDRRMDEVRRGIAALSRGRQQPPPTADPWPGWAVWGGGTSLKLTNGHSDFPQHPKLCGGKDFILKGITEDWMCLPSPNLLFLVFLSLLNALRSYAALAVMISKSVDPV